MPARVPDDMKRAVIQEWLQGHPRDAIANNLNLSAGVVTTIISEWRRALSYPVAEELRQLAVALRKAGISASQCARGFRFAMQIKNLSLDQEVGVDDDDILLESFVSEIYDNCKRIDLRPDKIASHVKQLLSLSETIPLSQIQGYIQQKIIQKERLEHDIRILNENIKSLEKQESDVQRRVAAAFEKEKKSFDDLKFFGILKEEMENYGLDINPDALAFSKTIKSIKELGFDVNKILSKISDLDMLEKREKETLLQIRDQQVFIANEENRKNELQQKCSFLEELIDTHNETISAYDQLQSIGFGLRELKLLWKVISEVSSVHNIPEKLAGQRFFQDIQGHYEDKLNYEGKLVKIQSEIEKSKKELSNLQTAISVGKTAAEDIAKQVANKFQEHGILNTKLEHVKNEIIREVSLLPYLSSLLILQFQKIQKIDTHSEFEPLTRAEKGGIVSIDELQHAVIRSLDLIIQRINTDKNSEAVSLLNSSKFAIENIIP